MVTGVQTCALPISAGQFDEAIRAMRDGIAYANVHTVTYPAGEIRGQINRRGR